ncbi:hypothetical protein BASA50_008314 [Batrachochytrium salamandrivorans]|uniref:Uncharacterized protein n=1 Tax=Batrachochytrium salamandrivorans TaxID=1357716 RepID=A0ABQ8F4H7_9FUNG|nr:hypothetical protein BASA62_007672 [Batrachochytrium salamandrivorans]KAH6570900.1 hypothetical protein BASA60_007507 [Batrachochytrium salamandrivorans]KAH6592031.1 hypothetical protein BASA50_008314 [Batrachochytrium salamandrivorans]KAH9272703.1 hypothetical protein BASA83_004905 [Batrachochytrium salamandrivorans]
MKLISFAVVSLLAITVSAYPQQTTTTQDLQPSQSTSTDDVQSSQSTSTQTPQQPDQGKVQAKLEQLTKLYIKEETEFAPVDKDLKAEEENVMEIERGLNSIVVELQDTSLSSDRKSELKERYDNGKELLEMLYAKYEGHYRHHKRLRRMRNDAEASLQLLKENQKLVEERNSDSEAQAGPSPDSVYDLEILMEQNIRILKEINELLEEQKNIGADQTVPVGSSLRERSEQLKDEIQILQSQSRTAKWILWWHGPNRSIGEWIKDVTGSYVWNSNI